MKKFICHIVTIIFGMCSVLICTCWSQYSYPRIKAHYSKEYIDKNKGRVIVEIPEVFELANIAIAIKKIAIKETNQKIKEIEIAIDSWNK